MKLRFRRCREQEVVFLLLFYLLVFQNPLSKYVSEIFNYTDELFGAVGLFFTIYLGFSVRKLRIQKETGGVVLPLAIFVLCGIGANVLYQYQPTKLVLKDLYVNLKFFLSIATGFYLFWYARPMKETILRHTKLCITILFVLLTADVLFDIFPNGGYRYGFKVRNLIFDHVTYLAGTCVFLLSIMLALFEKRNMKYIFMALLVLASTMRGKALGGVAAYVFLLYYIVFQQRRVRLWHILFIGCLGVWIAWGQISYYYIELSGQSARSVLTQTSFQIMKDYFPIGTGFGTYASDVAGEYYSPVYAKYGFLDVYELQKGSNFFSDTFWPIIIGQTGFAGTVCYLLVLLRLFLKTLKVRSVNQNAYAAVLFVFTYLLISSTSEPTFCNSVSIPLAMMLGYALFLIKEARENFQYDL